MWGPRVDQNNWLWLSQLQCLSQVRFLGIATQPFNKNGTQTRTYDLGQGEQEKCQEVMALVDDLAQHVPTARIRIHNTPSETIAHARLVLANQTIVGSGIFGVFPVVASSGSGCFRRPAFFLENHFSG